MQKQLYINGIGSGTYGVFLNSDTYLNSPNQDYTEYSIPARNGNLVSYNKRLNNVIRKFDCFINSDVLDNLDDFKKIIYATDGYMRLESDYDADTYQLGYLSQDIQVEPFNKGNNLQIKFSLYFSCMPQKWYKTNNTSSMVVSSDLGIGVNVFSRNDPIIQSALNQLPIDEQPISDYYLTALIYGGSGSIGAITNISATNSDGLVVVFYRNSNNSNWVKTVCYGEGSAGASSYTPPLQFGNHNLMLLVPIGDTDILATGSAHVGQGSSSISVDTSALADEISNSKAFGVSLDCELKSSLSSNALIDTPVVFQSFYNSVPEEQSMIVIHFDEMDADLIQRIKDDYSTGSSYDITIQISSDNTATIVKGTNALDITSYLEVLGNINGKADKVSYTVYSTATNPNMIKEIKLIPRWWKL